MAFFLLQQKHSGILNRNISERYGTLFLHSVVQYQWLTLWIQSCFAAGNSKQKKHNAGICFKLNEGKFLCKINSLFKSFHKEILLRCKRISNSCISLLSSVLLPGSKHYWKQWIGLQPLSQGGVVLMSDQEGAHGFTFPLHLEVHKVIWDCNQSLSLNLSNLTELL